MSRASSSEALALPYTLGGKKLRSKQRLLRVETLAAFPTSCGRPCRSVDVAAVAGGIAVGIMMPGTILAAVQPCMRQEINAPYIHIYITLDENNAVSGLGTHDGNKTGGTGPWRKKWAST